MGRPHVLNGRRERQLLAQLLPATTGSNRLWIQPIDATLPSDDSNGALLRNGAAWRDPDGAPNHDAQLLGGLALYANYPCANRPGADRLYDHTNGRHASSGRHGQAAALSAGRPCWLGSAKDSQRP